MPKPNPSPPPIADARAPSAPPALPVLAAGALLAFLAAFLPPLLLTFRDQARPDGYPLLDLRPYVGTGAPGTDPPAAATMAVCAALLSVAAFFALERSVRRAGFKAHVPAAAAACAVLFLSPAWAGLFRFDVSVFGDAAARTEADAALGGFVGRLQLGWRAFLDAPRDLLFSDPRADVPTGTGPFSGGAGPFVGPALHLLFLAAGMMLAGVRRTFLGAVTGLFLAAAAAVLLPAYVPGAPVFALLIGAAYLPTLVFSLATVGAPSARAVLFGLACGMVGLGGLQSADRARSLAVRAAALRLPFDQNGRPDFAAEKDPVRLLLFARDVPHFQSYDALPAAERARELLDARAPVLLPSRLEALFEDLLRTGKVRGKGLAPGARSPRFAELSATVSREMSHVLGLAQGGFEANLREITAALTETGLVPDLAELRALAPHDVEANEHAARFGTVAEKLAEVTARSGDAETSIVLRESLLDLGVRAGLTDADAAAERARVAVLRVQAGDFARGRDELLRWLPLTGERRAGDALRRGWLAVALFALGDLPGAYAEVKTVWSGVGGKWRDATAALVPDELGYWHLAEFAALRLELARKLDPELAPQARRDLDALTAVPLKASAPTVPALLFGARARQDGVRDAEALELLRTARRVPSVTLRDRSDGPGGRMASPRYRRLVLEALRAALTSPDDRDERSEIEAELARD